MKIIIVTILAVIIIVFIAMIVEMATSKLKHDIADSEQERKLKENNAALFMSRFM